MTNVVALVSSVKSKQTAPAAAKDLYTSPLFRGMRRYADTKADRWYILSTKHGLLDPDQTIEPYDLTLMGMPPALKSARASRTAATIVRRVPAGTLLLVLAGCTYVAGLKPLVRGHYLVEEPMAGLSLGRRLAWLKRANGPSSIGVA